MALTLKGSQITMSGEMSQRLRKILLFGQGMEQKEKAAAIAQLIAGVGPFFERKGFKYATSHQSFVKRDDELSWSFGLGLFVHPDAFTIRPVASVRHELIERLFHRISGAPETVQRHSATVLWQWLLEKRTPKPHMFTVNRSSKVAAGVEFVARFVTKWVEPFFAEHSSLIAISNSYNEGRAVLRAQFVTDRFEMVAKALIAARLAGRSDYAVLKHEYRQAMQKWKPPGPAGSFDALIQVLDENQ